MNLNSLTDINDPLLAPFANLKFKKDSEHIVVDGSQNIHNLLEQGSQPTYLIAIQSYYDNLKLIPTCPCYLAPKELLEQLIGFKLHQGVLALYPRPKYYNLTELGERILCLNGLTAPENVGTIVRSMIGFGVHSLLIDAKTVSPYSRRAARVSMGQFNRIKLSISYDLEADLKKLQSYGHSIIGTRNAPDSHSVANYRFPKKFTLLIGSESRGMDQNIEAVCEDMLKIRIGGGLDSLNAAQATSIILHRLYES